MPDGKGPPQPWWRFWNILDNGRRRGQVDPLEAVRRRISRRLVEAGPELPPSPADILAQGKPVGTFTDPARQAQQKAALGRYEQALAQTQAGQRAALRQQGGLVAPEKVQRFLEQPRPSLVERLGITGQPFGLGGAKAVREVGRGFLPRYLGGKAEEALPLAALQQMPPWEQALMGTLGVPFTGVMPGLAQLRAGVSPGALKTARFGAGEAMTRVPQRQVQAAGLRLAGAAPVRGAAVSPSTARDIAEQAAKMTPSQIEGRAVFAERQAQNWRNAKPRPEAIESDTALYAKQAQQWDAEAQAWREAVPAAAPEAAAPGVAPAAKEPWQMTRAEFAVQERGAIMPQGMKDTPQRRQAFLGQRHHAEVRTALSEGKPVPPEVLVDYPDLAAKAPKAAAPGAVSKVRPDIPPNMPESYVQARKRPDGKWQLFFTGTRNEVFPNELFASVSEAKMAFRVARAKAAPPSGQVAPPAGEVGTIETVLTPKRAVVTAKPVTPGRVEAIRQPQIQPAAPAVQGPARELPPVTKPPSEAVTPPGAAQPPVQPPGGRPPASPRAETGAVTSLAQGRESRLALLDDAEDFVRGADPSGGGQPPRRPPAPPGGGGDTPEIDDVFRRISTQATKGETPAETLLRRHSAAITTAENEARILLDEGSARLRSLGIGRLVRGRLVPREGDLPILDDFFEALHNPSKVASGEVKIPAGLEAEYARLRGLTNWEEAMRIDFDPAMATVDDYFYRGWIVPQEGVRVPTAPARGRLGTTPAFKKPRVDATYREMRDAGFEPISWNPYEQWRISRLQGVRYRQQMQLVSDMKRLEMAKTDASGVGMEGWRTPKVGPAFEGKIFATTDAAGEPVAMYSRRWVVPEPLANRLENIYGVRLDIGKVHVGNRGIDLLKAIDAVTFIPKRFKLFGSFFQQMDFLTRSYVGSWTGMIDALMAGQPIEAVRRLAVWPKSAYSIIEANLRPGARTAIRQQLNSTTPLIPGRPGIHLRGIMEGGLSTIDTTLLPANLDTVARQVSQEMGLFGNKAVQRAIGSLESSMRRGLFEGVYPAAQIADIKTNIAPMLVRRYGSLSDEALNGMIAKIVNKKYSTIPASQSVVQNRFLREGLRRLFFSMGESEGLLRQAAGAIRGPEAAYWRTHWLGAYLGLIALANAIHYASTGEMLPWKRWLPISKDKWGPLPMGYSPTFAAPDLPIKGKEGLNVTLDLVGQLDTALRILDLPSFLSSRESVPIRALTTQITERDYFGRPIDQVGPGGIFSRTANLISDMFAPIGIGQAAIQVGLEKGGIPKGLVPSSERGLGTFGQLIQGTGINLRAQYPERGEAGGAGPGLKLKGGPALTPGQGPGLKLKR